MAKGKLQHSVDTGWGSMMGTLMTILSLVSLLCICIIGFVAQYKEPSMCHHLKADHVEEEYFQPDRCWSRQQIQQVLRATTKTFLQLLETNGIEYWVDSGTLLGCIRSKGLIYKDYDADIGMPSHALNKLRSKKMEIPSEYVLAVRGSKIYEEKRRDDALPARFIHIDSGLYVDVFEFLYTKNATNSTVEELPRIDIGKKVEGFLGPIKSLCWMGCYGCLESNHFFVPVDWIYPLRQCQYEDINVSCPAQPDPYLQRLYGPRYMTPVSY
ncbi:hypothetical protein THRCLA_06197 [Thraustotheca clavata]|uniref:LicD/FKTN/FKRP nucleotidyltransferase domain-containing protein n=1 Tax=Thraustotheca clavata TaxID=74557 RepID=A0A1V9ZQ37_9STRA|nr:hypothetical protein THRCLA_06197 [Thraustotheca clavata]